MFDALQVDKSAGAKGSMEAQCCRAISSEAIIFRGKHPDHAKALVLLFENFFDDAFLVNSPIIIV